MRLHREVRGTPKAITVKREGRHWSVSIRCVDVPLNPLPKIGRSVGIDVGIVNLVATSGGQTIDGHDSDDGRRAGLLLLSVTSYARLVVHAVAAAPSNGWRGTTDESATSAKTSPTGSRGLSSTTTT